jgi:sec-independent protein translocase protein TatA
MFGIGTQELIIILILVLIIFGAGKLPEIGGAIGRSIKNFKKATRDQEEVKPPAETENKKIEPK